MTSFTIRGVEITEDVKRAMLLASLEVERTLGRKLHPSEMDILILAVVDRLAARTSSTTAERRLH